MLSAIQAYHKIVVSKDGSIWKHFFRFSFVGFSLQISGRMQKKKEKELFAAERRNWFQFRPLDDVRVG